MKEIELEMAKEETQMGKIREMVKERNRNRHHTKATPPKRRKLGASAYSSDTEDQATNNQAKKRKPDEAETEPEQKRPRTSDIKDLFRRQEEENVVEEEIQKVDMES